jgi:Mn2+/Fe2+ NRAMP family transporter
MQLNHFMRMMLAGLTSAVLLLSTSPSLAQQKPEQASRNAAIEASVKANTGRERIQTVFNVLNWIASILSLSALGWGLSQAYKQRFSEVVWDVPSEDDHP